MIIKNRRRRVETDNDKGISSQLLALSLFIMLLAFFIVLNAISNYEESRYQPVFNSLGQTFSSKITQQSHIRPSVSAAPEQSIQEGSVLERMKLLFTSQIPGQKSALNMTRGTLYVQVPYDEFESAVMMVGDIKRGVNQAGSRQNSAMGGMFLPTLTALMKGADAGLPYRMDMVLNIDGNPARVQNEKPQDMAAIMKDMSRIASRLEQAGLSQKLVTTGVQQGKAGTVDLFFRLHSPFNPLGDEINP